MLNLLRRRRGVSPVVSTIFLFAVIIGAIAVSLGIVYPNVERLSDQIELQTSATSLITLDRDITNLIQNGENSHLLTKINTGRSGLLQLDQISRSQIQAFDGGILVNQFRFNLTHYRIQIVQTINRDVIEAGNYNYLSGSASQNLLYLNQSTRNSVQWEIINQSRPTPADTVYTSLSYRNLVDSKTDLDFNIPAVNITLQFQVVNFTIPNGGSLKASRNSPQISMTYKGSSVLLTNYTEFSNGLTVSAISTLSDPGSINSFEPIYREEAPLGNNVKFFVRFQFTFFEFEIIL